MNGGASASLRASLAFREACQPPWTAAFLPGLCGMKSPQGHYRRQNATLCPKGQGIGEGRGGLCLRTVPIGSAKIRDLASASGGALCAPPRAGMKAGWHFILRRFAAGVLKSASSAGLRSKEDSPQITANFSQLMQCLRIRPL